MNKAVEQTPMMQPGACRARRGEAASTSPGHQVAHTVNAGLTLLYWHIGARIRHDRGKSSFRNQ